MTNFLVLNICFISCCFLTTKAQEFPLPSVVPEAEVFGFQPQAQAPAHPEADIPLIAETIPPATNDDGSTVEIRNFESQGSFLAESTSVDGTRRGECMYQDSTGNNTRVKYIQPPGSPQPSFEVLEGNRDLSPEQVYNLCADHQHRHMHNPATVFETSFPSLLNPLIPVDIFRQFPGLHVLATSDFGISELDKNREANTASNPLTEADQFGAGTASDTQFFANPWSLFMPPVQRQQNVIF